jgi:uncharacterized protein (DUF58 family)
MFKNIQFFKRDNIVEKVVDLNHQRVFILPTKRGLSFLVLIAILFLIAFVYNNNLCYLLAFLLSSVFLISILHSYQSIFGLRLELIGCDKVFAGEMAGVNLLLSNPMNIDRVDLNIGFSNSKKLSLGKQKQKKLILFFFVEKRGWHKMNKIVISSTYPFGFFTVWSSIRFSKKYLAYPAPTSDECPLPVIDVDDNIEEELMNSSIAGGDDFYGLKTYQDGDAIKQIDWKSFAKGQGLYIKQFQQNAKASNQQLWLDYDFTTASALEQKLSQLCRWVVDAEKQGLDYGFSLPGLSLQPTHGLNHYQQCLEALALYKPAITIE